VKTTVLLKSIAYFMLTAAVVLITVGVYYYTEENKFLDKCRLITCKITEITESTRGDAILTFREVNGNYPPFKYNVHYDASEDDLDYQVNEIHEVYYYEKDVSKSEIKSLMINHETSFILFMIGIVCFIDFPTMLFVAGLQKKKILTKQSAEIGLSETERKSIISE
jgi:hypothetical protein